MIYNLNQGPVAHLVERHICTVEAAGSSPVGSTKKIIIIIMVIFLLYNIIMLLTPHTLVGASIGASIQNIPLIIVLGISSHFVLDAIPHFDWGTWHNYEKDFQLEAKDYILLICDIMLATVLFYWVWNANNFDYLMLLGAFCAVLPDLIDNVPFWKQISY